MEHSLVFCFLIIAVFASIAHGCADKHKKCPLWTKAGFCKRDFVYFMKKNCRKSCNLCGGGSGENGGNGKSGKCGYKPSARIVGGTEAPKGAWPWQAQIKSTSGSPFCGGTLIHPQWVVTAAHCVSGRSASSISVRLGAHYLTRKVGKEQDFQIEKVISHYSYRRPFGLAHDIAMLKLRKPARTNRAVNLACLPGSSGSVSDGKMCWVTGFGKLSSEDLSQARVLMQVSVPIVDQRKCRSAYGSLIHDSMICAGLDKGGKDACQGDSGGPMVCESGGKFYLEGVVSWGHGCAAPGKYGVYARVRYLKQWVDKIMREN